MIQIPEIMQVRLRFLTKERLFNKRVAGLHNNRMDGMSDLLVRCRDTKILDIGCNRGMVSYDFASHGAKTVHGCDNYEPGIIAATEVFADFPVVDSEFKLIDLTKGFENLKQSFGRSFGNYDIVLFLALDHELQRIMPQEDIDQLVLGLLRNCRSYFAYRGRTYEHYEDIFKENGFKRVHFSDLAQYEFGAPAVIWERQK